MSAFPASFTRAAQMLRRLERLDPGCVCRVSEEAIMDCEVPANPLDRQTKEFLINWFRVRLPYPSEVTNVLHDGSVIFRNTRPAHEGEEGR